MCGSWLVSGSEFWRLLEWWTARAFYFFNGNASAGSCYRRSQRKSGIVEWMHWLTAAWGLGPGKGRGGNTSPQLMRVTKELLFAVSSRNIQLDLQYVESFFLTTKQQTNNNNKNNNFNNNKQFQKTSNIYSYNTRSSTSGKFSFFLGVKLWNKIPSYITNLPKKAFKRIVRKLLFDVLEMEDDYIEISLIIKNYGIRYTC